jgi:RimJ/RimL family protein N-acetyltransferase
MNARIPERLLTARMTCERLAPAHERDLARLMLDPRVGATLWPRPEPPSEADVHQSFADRLEHWEIHGFGLWFLRDSEGGEMIGRGGLQYTAATGAQVVEAAWTVRPELWGRGFATELAEATVRVAFDDLGLDELIALTLIDNLASRRVMEKSGFAFVRELVHVGLLHTLYVCRRET